MRKKNDQTTLSVSNILVDRLSVRGFDCRLSRGAYFVALLFSIICPFGHTQGSRKPQVEILGDKSWFDNTPGAAQYLLRQFTKTEGNVTIEWPPKDLRRIIDISVDVTGSVFHQFVQLNGHRISLAEYNVRQLYSYLFGDNDGHGLVQPGDVIFLRLFAARPGGQDIPVDEYRKIDFPPVKVAIEAVNIFTRRSFDRQIIVDRVLADPSSQSTAKNAISDWLLDKVSKAEASPTQYVESPLLKHIWKISRIHSTEHDIKKILIFVTDGYFHIGSIYFSPRSYSKDKHLPEHIKQKVSEMAIKPFTASESNINIILLGLSYNDDQEFRQAEEGLLRWFFAPLDKESVTLIFN